MKYEGKTWRVITNLWTVVTMAMFTFDFFSNNTYDASAGAIAAIYIAILSIYVGTKEFERWHTNYRANYWGEIYIIIWTAFTVMVVVWAPFSGGHFRIPTELVVVYTVVLSIFAISRRSKSLYSKRQSSAAKPLAKLKKYVKVKKRQVKKNNEKRHTPKILS